MADAGKLRSIRRIHMEYHHHIDGDIDTRSFSYWNVIALGIRYEQRLPLNGQSSVHFRTFLCTVTKNTLNNKQLVRTSQVVKDSRCERH
jgi:hypothetical protein